MATALALSALAAPTANAQSVKGSGETVPIDFFGYIVSYKFTVNAYINLDGTAGGKIGLATTYTPYVGMPGGTPRSSTTNETYVVESLSVTGSRASVWARATSNQALRQFSFTDNGDGSVQPDYFGIGDALGSPLRRGHITITP
jgi:hypothetical protein